MLFDDLEGWDEGAGGMGGSKSEGIYVYIYLIHFSVQQKLIQHCKAIILKKTENPLAAHLPLKRLCYDVLSPSVVLDSLRSHGL